VAPFKRCFLAFKLFAGGPLGNGKQWFPWIHMDDLTAAILFIIENPAINKAVVDILEGTMPAFDNRDSKYY